MTLVIAAPGEEFIILGADSRGVVDSGAARVQINTMRKLIPLTNYTAVLIYGSSEAANHLVEKFISERAEGLTWVKEVADAFSEFCREEERRLAGVPRHPDSWNDIFGFIIAGLKQINGGYKTYAYDLCSFDGFRLGLCRPYAIQGKSLIARYIFAKKYNEGLTVNNLSQLVAQSIYDTERIDGDVGGEIRLAIIDSDGLREIPTQDIRELVESWELEGLRRII